MNYQLARIEDEIERLRTGFSVEGNMVAETLGVPLEAVAGYMCNMLTGGFVMTAEGAAAMALAVAREETTQPDGYQGRHRANGE